MNNFQIDNKHGCYSVILTHSNSQSAGYCREGEIHFGPSKGGRAVLGQIPMQPQVTESTYVWGRAYTSTLLKSSVPSSGRSIEGSRLIISLFLVSFSAHPWSISGHLKCSVQVTVLSSIFKRLHHKGISPLCILHSHWVSFREMLN